ncbi:type IV pilus biogenesis/stability protein PilW [Thalassotalea agariperforans]
MASVNMVITVKSLVLCVALGTLSGCVTQQYSDASDNPIVQNDATNNEIAMTRISLGIGYLNMGNTKQAKLNLEKAKRFAPNLVQVHTAFAHYYDTVGEADLAIKAYEKALSIKGDDPDTLNNYGVFLCRKGHLEKAEQQFLKAIAVPSYILVSESYENLAICHLKAEYFTKAEEYFNKAIEHSPSRASSLYQMASLQYIKGDYIKAQTFIKRYEKATRRFSAEALALSFKVYEKLRDINTAKNYAAMLLKMFPNSYEAKQYLLNGLVEIEADKQANVYRMKHLAKKKKRVLKLTPQHSKISTPVKPDKTAETISTSANKLTDDTTAIVTSVTDDASRVVDKQEVTQAQQTTQIEASSEEEILSSVDKFLAKSTANASKVLASKKPELNNKAKVISNNGLQQLLNIPIHVVTKGDSLFSISKKHNIQMKALIKWNKLKTSSVLKIGDVIYLADPVKAAAQ